MTQDGPLNVNARKLLSLIGPDPGVAMLRSRGSRLTRLFPMPCTVVVVVVVGVVVVLAWHL